MNLARLAIKLFKAELLFSSSAKAFGLGDCPGLGKKGSRGFGAVEGEGVDGLAGVDGFVGAGAVIGASLSLFLLAIAAL
jgi:hypothetical protein